MCSPRFEEEEEEADDKSLINVGVLSKPLWFLAEAHQVVNCRLDKRAVLACWQLLGSLASAKVKSTTGDDAVLIISSSSNSTVTR